MDVERAGPTFDHFGIDRHFFDATQVGELEHGVEQDALHDRAQAACAGLPLEWRVRATAVRASSVKVERQRSPFRTGADTA